VTVLADRSFVGRGQSALFIIDTGRRSQRCGATVAVTGLYSKSLTVHQSSRFPSPGKPTLNFLPRTRLNFPVEAEAIFLRRLIQRMPPVNIF